MADLIVVIILGIIVGIIFGFILQRGRFCMNSAFRDIILLKEYKLFKGVMLILGVSMIGFSIMILGGIVVAAPKPFTVMGSILGGFIFGLGMVLAAGCASGTTYRVGEGMIGSLIALIGLAVGVLITGMFIKPAMAGILFPVNDPATGGSLTIAGAATPIVMLIIGIILIAILSYTNLLPYLKEKKANNTPIFDFSDLGDKIFKKPYLWWVSGLAIGILNCFAWVASASIGRNYPMGITKGWGDWLKFALTWDAFLVLGVVVGAFIAAIISKEFKIRVPKDKKILVQQVIGGFLMGFGAVLALGCNIGNFLSGIPMGSVGSLVVGICIIIGCWVMTYILFMRDTD